MSNALTFEELQELAQKYYTKGGDNIVECWDYNTFNDYVKEFGPITKKDALAMFKRQKSVEREWYAMYDNY